MTTTRRFTAENDPDVTQEEKQKQVALDARRKGKGQESKKISEPSKRK